MAFPGIFHRLDTPVYVGGLPASHDLINDPVANGFVGKAPSGALGYNSDVAHPNEGSYFVGLNEDGTSPMFNRGHKALAENTDYLDNIVHRDLAMPAEEDYPAPGAPVTDFTITGDVYVGSPGFVGDAETMGGLVQLYDLTGLPLAVPTVVEGITLFTPVIVSNIEAVLAGGNVVGTGYVTDPVISVSPAIPVGLAYRAHFGVRSNLVDQIESALSPVATGRGLWDGLTVAAVNSLAAIVPKRRSVTGSLSDGAGRPDGSTGGAINSVNAVEDAMAGPTTFPEGGRIFLQRGSYDIDGPSPPWTRNFEFWGELTGPVDGKFSKPVITLKATMAATDLVTPDTDTATFATDDKSSPTLFHNVILRSETADTGALVVGTGGQLHLQNATVDPGALVVDGARSFMWDKGTVEGTSVNARDAAFEMTGDVGRWNFPQNEAGPWYVKGVSFSGVPTLGAKTAVGWFHDGGFGTESDDLAINIEDCTFLSIDTGVPALHIDNFAGPLIFKRCQFRMGFAGGTALACLIEDSNGIIFEDCTFYSTTGRALRVEDSGALFKRCKFFGGALLPGGVSQQLLACTGGDNTTGSSLNGELENKVRFEECYAQWGVANVEPSSSAAEPMIFFGGLDATKASAGVVEVDGFVIRADSAADVHGFTPVVLANYPGTKRLRNSYRNVTLDMEGAALVGFGVGAQSLADTVGNWFCMEVLGNGAYSVPAGAGDPGSVRTYLENISIINIDEPSVVLTHAKGVFYANDADVHGLTIETDQSGGTDDWGNPLVELTKATVYDLSLFRRGSGFLWDSAGAFGLVHCRGQAEVRGGFIMHRKLLDGPLVRVDDDSTLTDVNAFVTPDASMVVGNDIVTMPGFRGTVRGCKVVVAVQSGALIDGSGGEAGLIDSNFVHRTVNGTAISGTSGGAEVGNIGYNTGPALPTMPAGDGNVASANKVIQDMLP